MNFRVLALAAGLVAVCVAVTAQTPAAAAKATKKLNIANYMPSFRVNPGHVIHEDSGTADTGMPLGRSCHLPVSRAFENCAPGGDSLR